ncbi:MAG TPA: CGNR zinc finger domain-containing protein [Actinomycetota bacterium]|nr:CGNR zinc finger domain-containing protein [Actinomycetota bacterium]
MDPSAQDQQADRTARLAVDLVNLRIQLKDAPLDAAVLRRFLADHGEEPPIRLDEAGAAAIAAVEPELRAVFDAPGVDPAAGMLNRLLERAGNRPRLSDHDGTPWHLHVTDEDASWADWLAATTGLGLARLLAEDGTARLGRCAAPGCRRVFAGGPRNHRRRYCSPACGNAARVAAFRARRRGRTGGRGTDPVSRPGRQARATGP